MYLCTEIVWSDVFFFFFSSSFSFSSFSFSFSDFAKSSGVLLYDFFFFFLHWGMHEFPFLKNFHRTHHGRLNVEAKDVLRHSIIDGSLQVALFSLYLFFLERAHPFPFRRTGPCQYFSSTPYSLGGSQIKTCSSNS